MHPQTILLVEDDELLAVLFELVLTESGYGVTRARNGWEALSKLAADAPPIDALITDIDLGDGPNGWEVARRARSKWTTLPVIYLTEGAGAAWEPHHVPRGALLLKPFKVARMVEMLIEPPTVEQAAGRTPRCA